MWLKNNSHCENFEIANIKSTQSNSVIKRKFLFMDQNNVYILVVWPKHLIYWPSIYHLAMYIRVGKLIFSDLKIIEVGKLIFSDF